MADSNRWSLQTQDASPAPVRETASADVPLSGPRWTSLLGLLAFLLVLRFVVPYLAEEVSYAIKRGGERAAYEAAATTLADTPFNGLSQAYQAIAKKVSPSVVHINVRTVQPDLIGDGFLYRRFEETSGQGSGAIMDGDGYIVTNYHVVRNAANIEVALSDGRRVDAKLVGADALTDIAVIKIDASKLIPAEWGDSDSLEVGSMVWALGSPFGLQSSITFGILSAKNRKMEEGPYQGFLQTDAAVNPGNSGGPLVDALGRVVGINTAIIGESYQGISFAVPSSVARSVYENLKAKGVVERGWLGVVMEDVTPQLAEQLGVEPRGAFVRQVVPGVDASPSPARQAGILPGDVIVAWNDQKIERPSDLSRAVAVAEVDTVATVRLIRDGQVLELPVRVGKRPNVSG